jgi:hypothetical protein
MAKQVVQAFTVSDGKIVEIDAIADPERVRRVGRGDRRVADAVRRRGAEEENPDWSELVPDHPTSTRTIHTELVDTCPEGSETTATLLDIRRDSSERRRATGQVVLSPSEGEMMWCCCCQLNEVT